MYEFRAWRKKQDSGRRCRSGYGKIEGRQASAHAYDFTATEERSVDQCRQDRKGSDASSEKMVRL